MIISALLTLRIFFIWYGSNIKYILCIFYGQLIVVAASQLTRVTLTGVAGATHGAVSANNNRNRAATAAMNRTAIGLSSLSHRERELLS